MTTRNLTTTALLPAKVWKGAQSLHFERLFSVSGEKVRITIKRDSYAGQSYIHAHILRGKKWEFLAGLPIAAHMDWFEENSPYAQGAEQNFAQNSEELIDSLLTEVEILLG